LGSAALLVVVAAGQASHGDDIQADSLRGKVSFLASDLLEGRDTPSRGLDIAADYIASEFRSAALESPVGPDYCQSAEFVTVSDRGASFQFSLWGAGEPPRAVAAERIWVSSYQGARVAGEPVFKWAPGVKIDGSLAGRVLMLREPSNRSTVATLALAMPDAIVELVRTGGAKRSGVLARASQISAPEPAIVSVPERDVEATFDRLPTGMTTAHATLMLDAPIIQPARLCNMVGLLRGSDPQLRDEYILVSAHYDHLGVAAKGKIFHGANDNASGTAAVLELARALSLANPKPRRSLAFLCFFGEEKDLLGSQWYVDHPVFPLARTVAEINFEQLGETEPSDGLPAATLGVTGYGFSNLPQLLSRAIQTAGATLKDTRDNEEYFNRSDNYPFAVAGVPAHTFVAAYDFPDYHRVTDDWQKLDYDNMAKLVRSLAAGIGDLASRSDSPRWNESGKTKGYLSAWHLLHP
jgi:hypothetical protein